MFVRVHAYVHVLCGERGLAGGLQVWHGGVWAARWVWAKGLAHCRASSVGCRCGSCRCAERAPPCRGGPRAVWAAIVMGAVASVGSTCARACGENMSSLP